VFIPSSFRIDDRNTLLAFIERYGFATLISTDPNGVPFATHVPLLLDRSSETLLGHIARANPQWEMFGDRESLAIFHGPHAYVSPSWYTVAPAVPTWNYATVHVYGTLRVLDSDRTADVVERLVSKYEMHRPTPWPGDMPDDYRRRMLAGIVGFEMPLTRIEGKFKLGQNRSAEDRAGTIAGLRADGGEATEFAAFTEGYLSSANPERSSPPS
jgi:transcriptional regulator